MLAVHHYYRFKLSLTDDKKGNLVDVYLSDVNEQRAAEKIFKQAHKTAGVTSEQITTDKEKVLYPAVKNVFDDKAKHRDSKYKNNIIEQNHRGIKSRYKVMKGFKNVFCALMFCTAFAEIRQFCRMAYKIRIGRRRLFTSKFQQFNNLAIQI